MDFEQQLRMLENAHRSPALLAFALVDLVHYTLSEHVRRRIKDALAAASVPHWCDRDFLAALLATTHEESDELLGYLRALTIIEAFPTRGYGAINVHEAARLAIREHLRTNDVERWQRHASTARSHLGHSKEPHAQIEALYHLFAIEQSAAARECEQLDRQFTQHGRPDVRHALALALTELTTSGWLTGVAQVEALLASLELRNERGEEAQLESQARHLVDLARDTSDQSCLSRANCLLGDVLKAKGRLEEAAETYRQYLIISERLLSSDTSDLGRRREVAIAYSKIGDIYDARGQLEDAAVAFRQFLSNCEAIATSDPTNYGCQRELGHAYARIGDIDRMRGRLNDAAAAFRKYLAISQRLVASDPSNLTWQSDLAGSYGRMGTIYRSQGKLDDAITLFHEWLDIAHALSSSDPSNAMWQVHIAVASGNVGEIALAQGRLDYAATTLAMGLVVSENLASSDPGNADWQRLLAVAYCRIGDMHKLQGRPDAAAAAFHKYRHIFESLTSLDPSNGDWQRNLAIAYCRVGDIYNDQGHPDEAAAAFRKHRDIFEHLVSLDSSNSDWQRSLGIAYSRIGDFDKAHGRFDEAGEAFRQDRAIFQRLVSFDPSNADWQRNLAIAYCKSGYLDQARGRLDDAESAFRRYLAIYESLASSEPSNATWRRELASAYFNLAALYQAQGEPDDAAAALREHQAISEAVDKVDDRKEDMVTQEGERKTRWLELAPKVRPRQSGIKWDVFVSYRSVNRAWALALYDGLREAGFHVFLDQFVLPAGMGIEGFLRDNLKASASGVVVWSGDAASSKFVESELRVMRALKQKRDDFFYVLAKLDDQELPFLEQDDLYIDFTRYPEGPRGGELLRLMFGLLGQPLSNEAVREIQELDLAMTTLVAQIRAAKAAGNIESLRKMALERVAALTATSVPYGVLIESLIEMGALPEALEVLAQARRQFPQGVRLQQLHALAYRRSGRVEEAQLILNVLYDQDHRDPETVGILAATWMQRYKKEQKKIYLERSQSLYAEAFRLAPDSYYNGINAASKAALLGRLTDASTIAGQVLPLVVAHEDGRDYWMTATHAEVRLLRREFDRAAGLYRAAVIMHLTEVGSIGSTRTQATDLLDALGADETARASVLGAFSLE